MKFSPVLLVSVCFMIAGCGQSEISPSDPASTPSSVQPQQKPVQPAVVDSPYVAVELEESHYHRTRRQGLSKRNDVFFADQVIWAGRSGVDLVRMEFSASAIVADPDATYVMGRYGCANPRIGDIYYRSASLGYAATQRSTAGASIVKVSAYNLLDVFRICAGRNVAIALDLYKANPEKPEATVVFYLRGASS